MLFMLVMRNLWVEINLQIFGLNSSFSYGGINIDGYTIGRYGVSNELKCEQDFSDKRWKSCEND